MNNSHRRAGTLAAFLAVVSATAAHAADPRSPLADPADAGAYVPPTRYQSFYSATPAAVSPASPSQQWKALNQVVASYDSMSLTMDMAAATSAEGRVSESPAAVAAPAPAPAHVPKKSPTTPPVADPHAHHHPKAGK